MCRMQQERTLGQCWLANWNEKVALVGSEAKLWLDEELASSREPQSSVQWWS